MVHLRRRCFAIVVGVATSCELAFEILVLFFLGQFGEAFVDDGRWTFLVGASVSGIATSID